MKLVDRTHGVSYSPEDKKFLEFSFFNFVQTERNWFGDEYISKNDVEWFVEKLREMDKMIASILPIEHFRTKIWFLFDTSIFSNQNRESNDSLLEFLEEIETIHSFENQNPDTIRFIKKAEKKLNFFAAKIENIPYLYRFMVLYPTNPFTLQMKQTINKTIKEQQELLIKDTLQNTSTYETNPIHDAIKQTKKHKTFELYTKMFKYSIDEPSLFFFSAYALTEILSVEKEMKFVQKIDDREIRGGYMFAMDAHTLFTMFKEGRKNQAIYYSVAEPEDIKTFLRYEAAMREYTHFPTDGYSDTLSFIEDLRVLQGEEGKENIEPLKSIAKWALEKMFKKDFELPNFYWYYRLNKCPIGMFDNTDIRIIHEAVVQGEKDKEFVCHAHVADRVNKGNNLIFPLLNPDSWDGMSFKQCLATTFFICFLHDVVSEKGYKTVYRESGNGYTYDFYELQLSQDISRFATHVKKTEKEKDKKNEKKSRMEIEKEAVPKKETWVSFHFRKLPANWNSRDYAKQKAEKYGIRIPKGYTFVDSFVRGESEQKDVKVRVSAMEVLLKTYSKIESIITNEEMDKINSEAAGNQVRDNA